MDTYNRLSSVGLTDLIIMINLFPVIIYMLSLRVDAVPPDQSLLLVTQQSPPLPPPTPTPPNLLPDHLPASNHQSKLLPVTLSNAPPQGLPLRPPN